MPRGPRLRRPHRAVLDTEAGGRFPAGCRGALTPSFAMVLGVVNLMGVRGSDRSER